MGQEEGRVGERIRPGGDGTGGALLYQIVNSMLSWKAWHRVSPHCTGKTGGTDLRRPIAGLEAFPGGERRQFSYTQHSSVPYYDCCPGSIRRKMEYNFSKLKKPIKIQQMNFTKKRTKKCPRSLVRPPRSKRHKCLNFSDCHVLPWTAMPESGTSCKFHAN